MSLSMEMGMAWALGACSWPSVTAAVVGLAGDGITSRMDRGI